MSSMIAVFFAVNVAVAFSQLCCTPPQWEGLEGFTTGYVQKGITGKMEGLVKVSYDAQNSKLAADTKVYAGNRLLQSRVIFNYQEKKQYTIVKESCTVTKLQTPFPKSCIPDGSEKYPAYFGIGDDGLDVDMYNIKLSPYPGVQVSATVTRRDCIPVGETMSGVINTVSFMEVVGFFNITAGIKNPDVFVPPASCKEVFYNQTLNHEYLLTRMQTKLSQFGF